MEKSIHTPEYTVMLRLLRQERERAGVTQVELAARLRQTQSFVSKIELGDNRLDLIQLRTILGLIGVRLTDFVERFEREVERHR
jgi:transcriptional regulator with XRE-family HTH domain